MGDELDLNRWSRMAGHYSVPEADMRELVDLARRAQEAELRGVRKGLEAAVKLCEKHHDRDEDKAGEHGTRGEYRTAATLLERAEGFAFATMRIRALLKNPAAIASAMPADTKASRSAKRWVDDSDPAAAMAEVMGDDND